MASGMIISSTEMLLGIMIMVISCGNLNFSRAAGEGMGCNGERLDNGMASSSCDPKVNTRQFQRHGCAAHLYVLFGAYRGGNRTFSIIGLASKPLHTFGSPSFSCEWIGAKNTTPVAGTWRKDLPDRGFGRAYTVVIVTCSFDSDVGTDSEGGQLILTAYHGLGALDNEERIVAMVEKAGDYNAKLFEQPYEYDFVYCGSPLFGRLNPELAREWMAYHDLMMGERTHFVLYDAGGINKDIRNVLEPWIENGRISIHDIRSTQYFDGYYFNQFLIVNDCVQRSKFLANWTFFFDMDEFLYIEQPNTLHSVMEEHYLMETDQLFFRQYRMLPELCLRDSTGGWGFERMTYQQVNSWNTDLKYACNPRKVYSNGVHAIEQGFDNLKSERLNHTIGRYYHYHGALNGREEDMCKQIWYDTKVIDVDDHSRAINTSDGTLVRYDGSMIPLAPAAKEHAKKVIESIPSNS